tara:strand:+ start:314 stop:934 length:621 start_codon:yes stop_codon:yes gene_type:complete
MSFSENGYEVVRNVISKDLLHHLKTEFQMMRDFHFFVTGETNNFAFGDDQSPNSFSVYSAQFFESLAINLNNRMSEITNLKLHPTYTYARIYYEGASLAPHKDRPSCEYSTTFCIDSTDVWDFHIKDRDGEDKVIKLNPGDMCVYSGCELEHWREPYQGEMQMQCFLHYVNAKGPYADHKYDKRPMMGIGTKISSDLQKRNKITYQ